MLERSLGGCRGCLTVRAGEKVETPVTWRGFVGLIEDALAAGVTEQRVLMQLEMLRSEKLWQSWSTGRRCLRYQGWDSSGTVMECCESAPVPEATRAPAAAPDVGRGGR